ncbi:MAG: hypothetical protein QXO67_01650 [Candidatus Bathyarchaeia archaeon]
MAKVEGGKKENAESAEPPGEESAEREKTVEKQEIEKLKFSVEKLSEELNRAVAELKRSIIDIRSAVSEIENPFNLLRVITSEKDLEKIRSEKLPPGVKSLIIGKPEGKLEAKIEEKPEKEEEKALPPPTKAPTPRELPEAEGLEREPEGVKAELEKPRPKIGTAYLDWVWSLLDAGFAPEDIRQLSESYENLGFLPRGCSGQIYSLAVAAEKAKSRGLTRGRLLLNMYKASIISGIGMGIDDLRRLIAIAERRSGKGKMAKGVE